MGARLVRCMWKLKKKKKEKKKGALLSIQMLCTCPHEPKMVRNQYEPAKMY